MQEVLAELLSQEQKVPRAVVEDEKPVGKEQVEREAEAHEMEVLAQQELHGLVEVVGKALMRVWAEEVFWALEGQVGEVLLLSLKREVEVVFSVHLVQLALVRRVLQSVLRERPGQIQLLLCKVGHAPVATPPDDFLRVGIPPAKSPPSWGTALIAATSEALGPEARPPPGIGGAPEKPPPPPEGSVR